MKGILENWKKCSILIETNVHHDHVRCSSYTCSDTFHSRLNFYTGTSLLSISWNNILFLLNHIYATTTLFFTFPKRWWSQLAFFSTRTTGERTITILSWFHVAEVNGWRSSKLRFFILTKCEPRKAEERRRRYRSEERETTRVRWAKWKIYISLVAPSSCTARQADW